jgi:hypothetical protein
MNSEIVFDHMIENSTRFDEASVMFKYYTSFLDNISPDNGYESFKRDVLRYVDAINNHESFLKDVFPFDRKKGETLFEVEIFYCRVMTFFVNERILSLIKDLGAFYITNENCLDGPGAWNFPIRYIYTFEERCTSEGIVLKDTCITLSD